MKIYDEINARVVQSIEEIPTDEFLQLEVNSPGGTIFEAFAIRNVIRRRSAPTHARIDGVAYGAGLVSILGCGTVTIDNAGQVGIGKCSSYVLGDSEEVERISDTLQKIDVQVAEALLDRMSKKGWSMESILEAMEKETWWTAEEAMSNGIVDAIA